MKRGLMALLALGAGAVVAVAVGCNGILGIDEAKLDPTVGGDAGDGAADPCTEYCTLMLASCGPTAGANFEYTTQDTCVAMCRTFDEVTCRLSHARLAAAAPHLECRKAGPLGTGACGGTQCQAFCALDLALCTGQNPTAYSGVNDCLTSCAGYTYVGDAGEAELQIGDTLNCRTYHLEAAYAAGGSQVHCPHTAKVSITCSPPPPDAGGD